MLIKRNELTDIEMVMLPKDIMNKELGAKCIMNMLNSTDTQNYLYMNRSMRKCATYRPYKF